MGSFMVLIRFIATNAFEGVSESPVMRTYATKDITVTCRRNKSIQLTCLSRLHNIVAVI